MPSSFEIGRRIRKMARNSLSRISVAAMRAKYEGWYSCLRERQIFYRQPPSEMRVEDDHRCLQETNCPCQQGSLSIHKHMCCCLTAKRIFSREYFKSELPVKLVESGFVLIIPAIGLCRKMRDVLLL